MPSGLPDDVGTEPVDDAPRATEQESERGGEEYSAFGPPLRLWWSDAEKYDRGSRDLHVHGTAWGTDHCLVLHARTRVELGTSYEVPVWHDGRADRVSEAIDDQRKLRVAV